METKKKIVGMMTTGRYVCSRPFSTIFTAFNQAGISLINSGGVFYGQCMQRMFESAVEEGVDLIVTVDSDSLFTVSQLQNIISNAVADDSIDALAALQSRRGFPNPLFSIETDAKVGEEIRVEFEGKPLRVKTAHFGLTVIKVDKLKDVPKPWFFSKPSEDGSWGDDRIDDDIWFWKQWESAGNSVFIDSSVSIGHLEELVSCFDSNGVHRVMYPQDWRDEVMK